MKPDNAFMLELTENMPCKQINVNGVGYIQRYFGGTFINVGKETDLWFHRFLSADGDRRLHWRPMNIRSAVVCGSHLEEYMDNGIKREKSFFPCDVSRNFLINLCHKARNGLPLRKTPSPMREIGMHTIRRIAEVQPDTWTILLVEPERVPVWGFIDENGQYEIRKSSDREWWKNYKPRGQNLGDVL